MQCYPVNGLRSVVRGNVTKASLFLSIFGCFLGVDGHGLNEGQSESPCKVARVLHSHDAFPLPSSSVANIGTVGMRPRSRITHAGLHETRVSCHVFSMFLAPNHDRIITAWTIGWFTAGIFISGLDTIATRGDVATYGCNRDSSAWPCSLWTI